MSEIKYSPVELGRDDAYMVDATIGKNKAGSIYGGYVEKKGYLGHFLVEPDYRKGYKIGTELHRGFVEWSRSKGVKEIFVDVKPRKEKDDLESTIQFLLYMGWTKVDENNANDREYKLVIE